jgi:hypothetical protein
MRQQQAWRSAGRQKLKEAVRAALDDLGFIACRRHHIVVEETGSVLPAQGGHTPPHGRLRGTGGAVTIAVSLVPGSRLDTSAATGGTIGSAERSEGRGTSAVASMDGSDASTDAPGTVDASERGLPTIASAAASMDGSGAGANAPGTASASKGGLPVIASAVASVDGAAADAFGTASPSEKSTLLPISGDAKAPGSGAVTGCDSVGIAAAGRGGDAVCDICDPVSAGGATALSGTSASSGSTVGIISDTVATSVGCRLEARS